MTPEQVALVQRSFAEVEPIADRAADLFYDRLFERAPAVRPLFPDDMSDQKRKLMQMLETAVKNLHQVEQILGRKHVGYGAKPEHYDTVGEALLWTLEQGLGPAFTPPVKAAWASTYQTLAGVMQDAAAALKAPGR